MNRGETRQTIERRRTAKKLLVHYFVLAFDKMGAPLNNSDCLAEIGDIIDAIFDEIADSKESVNQTIGTVGSGAVVTGAKIDFRR